MADTGVTAPGLGEEKSLAKLKIQAGSSIFNAQNYSDTPDPSVPVSLKNTSTTVVISVGGNDTTLADATISDGSQMAPHLDGEAPHSMDELSSMKEKIICTTIYNSLGSNEWHANRILWNTHKDEHLTRYHQTGYYILFKPFTNLMRKNNFVFWLGKYMAKCRTQDIKAVMNNNTRYIPGMIIRYIFEPISFVIGYIILKVKG
tara:strand:+ start:1305 stop:1913 length:609 start_codon:yes stop_codon:yes gene_type:complete